MHPIGAFKHESMDKTEKKKKKPPLFLPIPIPIFCEVLC